MFATYSEPGDEESQWNQDELDVEPDLMEASRDLGLGLEGVKRYARGPSPREPVERHVTNYLVFTGDLDERAGDFSGIRMEYNPLKMKLEAVPEDDMAGFLKPGAVALGSPVADDLNNRADKLATAHRRKGYDPELAREVIEMADAKMDLGVPDPEVVDFPEDEIFRYSYLLP